MSTEIRDIEEKVCALFNPSNFNHPVQGKASVETTESSHYHIEYEVDDGEGEQEKTRMFFRINLEEGCIYFGKVDGVYVHPTFRGRGIGRQLVSAMEDLGRQLNLSKVLLPHKQPIENPSFWTHMGYTALEDGTFVKELDVK